MIEWARTLCIGFLLGAILAGYVAAQIVYDYGRMIEGPMSKEQARLEFIKEMKEACVTWFTDSRSKMEKTAILCRKPDFL